ncbi:MULTISPECIES: hypothetical protein [Flavobacterium]|uniref:hypothetical protein n=1 Tax=Flavobacterium TaxID=237 RepID=UPI0011845710|nr:MULTISPECIES: hypothetical protein [Flavobacterium]MCR4030284.1 hypothetical protein [Flavobacterium panacis]
MNKNYLKLISSIFISGIFVLIAFGSTDNEPTEVFKKNSKEAFCGKKFKSSSNLKEIDMDIDAITILNCDGTYTSKQDWGTSKSNQEAYNNAIGRSSGNNADFSGKWEIVESETNLPLEIKNDLSDFKGIEYSIIKYQSKKGKTRYALIYNYNDLATLKDWPTSSSFGLSLHIFVLPIDCYEYKTYRNEDLHMFEGFTDKY